MRFTVGETERLLIPLSSIVFRSEVTAVYVIKEGKPTLRQIRPGEIFTSQLEVLAGLKDGEMVEQMVGVQTKDKLEEVTAKYL